MVCGIHIPTLAGFCLLFVLCCCLVLLLWCVFVSCFCFVVFLVPVLQVSRNPEFSAQFRPR